MLSDVSRSNDQNLDWLLSGLLQRVPQTRSALLLSSDGIKKAFDGLDADGADHLAALASGLFSLARGAGERFDNGGGVRQLVAELDGTLLFVTSAGSGAVLAVLADRTADVGVLGYEMSQLVKGVRSYFATAPRQSGAIHGDAGQ